MKKDESRQNTDVNLVIDHLDEFASAITCACSTVADYVTETPPTNERN